MSAQAGDILLCSGTFTESNIHWPAVNDITLISSSETSLCTIDAGQAGRVIYFDGSVTATVEGFDLKNGYAYGSTPVGGCFYLRGDSSLFLHDVIVETCTSENVGGAFYAEDTSTQVIADSSIFQNNSSSSNPGGVTAYAQWSATNCLFEGNSCKQSLAAVSYGPTFDAVGCVFRNNDAWDGGGVFFVTNGAANVMNCTFEGNASHTTSPGGGVVYGTISATNCAFVNNSSISGGVVFSSNTFFDNCSFSGNSAASQGGVQFSGNCVVRGSRFAGNSADSGGVFFSSNVNATNSIFESNWATTEGGVALFGTLTGTNCVIARNGSKNAGVVSGGSMIFTNCTVYNNTAETGGVTSNSSLNGVNDIFWYNFANTSPVFGGGGGVGGLHFCDIQPNGWSFNGSNISAEPQFVSTSGAYDLHLTVFSPCIDSGTTEGAPAFDLDGRIRPIGAGVDMGAYEFPSRISMEVKVNGARFISGNLISSHGTITAHVSCSFGVSSLKMYLDSSVLPVVFTQTGGSSVESDWSGGLSISGAGNHILRFVAHDGLGLDDQLTYIGHISSGTVQVVGNPYNYPNPFKPLSSDPTKNVTQIQYTLSGDAPVTIIIYNITGQEEKRMLYPARTEGEGRG